jgi:RNA polymerase sigma-70 factor (ECF subfamily)
MEESQISDAELVKRLTEGDLDALGILYDRHYQQIYRTAMAVTGDHDAAEDILQDCFLRVHQYAHRINTSLPLPPWLYRVTVNLCYTWTRKHKRSKFPLEDFIERLVTPSTQAPDMYAERAELVDKIREAVDTLPVNQRVVVGLYYANNLNLQEIAEILDCPVGTVKSRLFHAREKLRTQLGPSIGLSDVAHGYIQTS